MAVCSSYHAKQMLDWQLSQAGHTHNFIIKPTEWSGVYESHKKPDPILDMKVGAAEAVAVGAAVLVGKNPVLSRRFWAR